MLAELQISDFAIITQLNLQLADKFNVFTGETGAGKSIIIDALGIVLGGRASPDMVRAGCQTARVQALFQLSAAEAEQHAPIMQEYGIEPTEDLILTREISANGRSTARVNGSLVPVSTLREIASGLVDITGQSEHLSLLRASTQLDMLDQYADCLDLRAEVSTLFSQLRALQSELDTILNNQQEAERRADMLRYQLEEIEGVSPQPGEDEELLRQRNLLANAESLIRLAESAYQGMYGSEPSALDQLRAAESSLEELVQVDNSLEDDLNLLREAVVNIEEISLTVRRYRDSVEYDPGALAQVEERLDQINRLKRKYGDTIEEILAYSESSAEELNSLENREERAEALQSQLAEARARLARSAAELSARRSQAAQELSSRIEAALADLLLARASVRIEVRQTETSREQSVELDTRRVEVTSTGVDTVEILLAPNPGEPPKPLARVASGGEISRIMLAIRSVLSEADRTPTLVFDEVDVGVGGRSGSVVGEKLYGISDSHQVITITHLAQVAAFADSHYRITKRVVDERTSTVVERLDDEAIREEIAAMLGGLPVTQGSLKSADELLARSVERKLDGVTAK